ncbi:C-X-C motif chemokine 11-6-like [Syngnathoides biaculeatus]|uniref:C-X-C motif chemokine 11-6-like n=1 Tax=Syngnathoides biaculeatus TaxID=300417 RepID=UPI002ADD6E8C|nr:C-X-C motif chemokine 11-6-like [Syngnathoides biaculeatus]
MLGTIKVIFLLVGICAAQFNRSQSCLCQDGKSFVSKFGMKEITIYPESTFCNKVEIVVSTKNGTQFCLNEKAVHRILTHLMKKKPSTAIPDSTKSALSGSNTTNI